MKHHCTKMNIEKNFLLLSLIFGSIFAVIFPIFYEGDAQHHFDYATYQANVVVNRSAIAGDAIFGYDQELTAMQEGNYFTKYFLTKATRIDRSEVSDKRVQKTGLANNILHLVPAIGVFLGYHIYPSIGIMIVTARLLMVILYSFSLYFIIKKVTYGKTLFVLTALTPVMMIEGISLSYDSLSFVFAATLMMAQINYFFSPEKKFLPVLFWSPIVYFFAKRNMQMLLIISALVVIDLLFDVNKIFSWIRKHRIPFTLFALIIISCGYYLFAITHGGFRVFSLRMFNSIFSIENEQYTRGIFLGIFGNYTASYSLPWWCLYGYSIILFIAIFGEKKPKIPPIISWLGSTVFLLNILGITAIYSTFKNSVSDPSNTTQIIGGQLGRYYTPLLPCLIFLESAISFDLAIDSQKRDKLVCGWSLFCLMLLLIITIYGFYLQKIPAFIQ